MKFKKMDSTFKISCLESFNKKEFQSERSSFYSNFNTVWGGGGNVYK